MKVLIVDDEPLAREGIVLLLGEEPGVDSVAQARNGAEAVGMIRESRPDLVLLDVQMPEMDGFETATLVRERDRSRDTPIIFLTALSRSETNAGRFWLSAPSPYTLHDPMLGRTISASPHDIMSCAGSCTGVVVLMERTMHISSTCLARCGNSSLTSMPLCPCFENLKPPC